MGKDDSIKAVRTPFAEKPDGKPLDNHLMAIYPFNRYVCGRRV
jgi:hypothetical protein